ncbi:uncharacterized protein [Bemisia tabaci]|uniref:uncharacterized protein n=1 Tax=Bemisia tabaci TaxID=7038 RepID=UPI003B28B71E
MRVNESKKMTKTIHRGLGGGEDFCLQKKGRSLSQSSFLFSNFINVPRNYEPHQKKTLALSPSIDQPRGEISNFPRDRPAWDRSSLINYKSCISHEPSRINHRSPLINRESPYVNDQSPFINYESSCVSSRSSNISSVSGTLSKSNLLFTDSESTAKVSAMASSYKYNPILPENQFSADESQYGASFTSLKNRILENIPLNLISNLDIFFNQAQKESLVSSVPSFESSHSNRRQYQKKSKSKVNPNGNSSNKSNLEFLTLPPFTSYQWGAEKPGYQKTFGPKFSGIYSGFQEPFQQGTQSSLARSQKTLRSSHRNQSSHLSSQPTEIVVLKSAKNSVIASGSSEALLENLNDDLSSSDTTLQCESDYGAEEKDVRVHYLKDSEHDESEYSLLASKGYTFAKKGSKRKPSTSSTSTYVPETELRVVNFSGSSLEPPHRKDVKTAPKRDPVQSSKGAFETTYESCHVVRSESSKGGSRHSKHKANRLPEVMLREKYFVEQDKAVRERRRESPQPARHRSDAETVSEKDGESCVGKISADRERTLRTSVEKISERFMRFERALMSDEESSTETIRKDIHERPVTDTYTSEESQEERSPDFDRYKKCNGARKTVHQSLSQKPTSRMFQKRKRRSRTGSAVDRNQSYTSSKSSQKFILSKNGKSKINRKGRNRRSVSSRSTLTSSRRFSKCSMVSDSTNAKSFRTRLRKGKRTGTDDAESRRKLAQNYNNTTVRSRKIQRKISVESEEREAVFCERAHKNLVSGRGSKIHKRPRKNRNFLMKRPEFSSSDLGKSTQGIGNVRKMFSHRENKNILQFGNNILRNQLHGQVARRDENIKNRMSEMEASSSCFETICNAKETPRKITKPEMDVYTRNDRKKFSVQGKLEPLTREADPAETKKISNLEDKMNAKLKALCEDRGKNPEKSIEDCGKSYVKDYKESFLSFRRSETLTDITEDSKPSNVSKNTPRLKPSESCGSVSSGMASSYLPNRNETIPDSEIEDESIVDSTSEYIKWAKNCLLKQRTESREESYSDEETETPNDYSEEAISDEIDPSKYRIRSSGNHRCVLSCEEVTEYSDYSFSLIASKSTLSVILEENGSADRSPREGPSQENSIAFEKRTLGHLSAGSAEVMRRDAAGDAGKNRSRKLSLSSESERDLEQLKNKIKLIKRSLQSRVSPRIIPSTSTLALEMSETLE